MDHLRDARLSVSEQARRLRLMAYTYGLDERTDVLAAVVRRQEENLADAIACTASPDPGVAEYARASADWQRGQMTWVREREREFRASLEHRTPAPAVTMFVVVITGPPGAGKTAVLTGLADALSDDDVAHAVLEVEMVVWTHPPPSDEQWARHVRRSCELYHEAGHRRLLVAQTPESDADTAQLLDALGAEQAFVVRLEAAPTTLAAHIIEREPASWSGLPGLVEHAQELAASMPSAGRRRPRREHRGRARRGRRRAHPRGQARVARRGRQHMARARRLTTSRPKASSRRPRAVATNTGSCRPRPRWRTRRAAWSRRSVSRAVAWPPLQSPRSASSAATSCAARGRAASIDSTTGHSGVCAMRRELFGSERGRRREHDRRVCARRYGGASRAAGARSAGGRMGYANPGSYEGMFS